MVDGISWISVSTFINYAHTLQPSFCPTFDSQPQASAGTLYHHFFLSFCYQTGAQSVTLIFKFHCCSRRAYYQLNRCSGVERGSPLFLGMSNVTVETVLYAGNVLPHAKCGLSASIKREYYFGDFFDKGLVVAVLSSRGECFFSS